MDFFLISLICVFHEMMRYVSMYVCMCHLNKSEQIDVLVAHASLQHVPWKK